MKKTLDGLLVVALEQAVAAPYCSSRLADAGARVIKIERSDGDFARGYDDVVHGESAYFVWTNRGKESLTLNIKDDADATLLRRIIGRADVFIQNLAPGAAARAGFDSQKLRETNPRLITVDISGYGESGPYQDMKAYDLLVQCESGLASINGTQAEPGRVGVSVCDIACGMYAQTAVLEALIARGISGQGRGIKISLFDSIADWMTVPLLHQDYGGVAPSRVGLNHPTIAPYGAYCCQDGSLLVLSVQSDREWRAFCTAVLLQPEIADDPRFSDNLTRCKNRPALDVEINRIFGACSREQLIQRLHKGSIAFGALNSVEDLSRHSQLRRVQVETPSGLVEMVAPPAILTEDDTKLGAVPALGEHSEQLRAEFAATP